MGRYARLYLEFLRIGLMKEMAFRANFLVRVITEVLWFILLCIFFGVIYAKTNAIGGWTKYQYLVLLGTHFVMTGIVETIFMPNFSELAEKVRSGKLDFALAKPVDEQFLLTLQEFDWATSSNVVFGGGMIVYALSQLGRMPSLVQCAVYAVTVCAGVAVFYSIMTMLAVTAVWVVRNQHLYEMWFYVNVFARYPPEIFSGPLGHPLRRLLTFAIPVLVVVAVPAEALSRNLLRPGMVCYAVAAAAAFLWLSRLVFRHTLKHYRSASS